MASSDPQKLSELIASAKPAHLVYEAEVLKGTDEDWPSWYADYLMKGGLNELLGADLTQEVLREFLIQLDQEYNSRKPGVDWPEYWAQRLIETTVSS